MRDVRSAKRRRAWVSPPAAMLVLAAACGSGGAAGSGDGAGGKESFEDETIHFVVAYEPGGSSDTIARALAPHLEEELGATVVVENEGGAGGLVAANQVFTAEPDGLTIGTFNGQGIAGATLGGAEGVQFDLGDFSYLGRLNADPRVSVANPDGEYETIEDVRAGSDVRFASTGPGGSDNLDAAVLISALDIDGEIVTGYESSPETAQAIASGDVDLGNGSVSTRLPGIRVGEFRPILVIGEERVDQLPDLPAVTELDLDDESMALVQAHIDLQNMGRMLWAPPDVPEDRLAALEDAFTTASENPKFLKKMKNADQNIDFMSGDEAKSIADDVLDAPDEYKTLLEKAYEGQ